MSGPPPKRQSERRRTNEPLTPVITVNYDLVANKKVQVPAPAHDWDPIARNWYMSLTESLQSVFYEPSDWMTAWLLAEMLSRELLPVPIVNKDGEVELIKRPMAAGAITSFLKGAASLLTSEADRRRVRIEIERAKEPERKTTQLGADPELPGDVLDFTKRRAGLLE